MDICDRIGTSSAGAKESLKIIIKRLNNGDPHVIMQAITVMTIYNFSLKYQIKEYRLFSALGCLCKQLWQELSFGDC